MSWLKVAPFNKSLKESQGFTLIELLLAMTLFITVMVIATVGFIGMNRVFVRGLVKKSLSESVQRVTEDTTKTVRANAGNNIAPPTSSGGFSKLCFGTVSYVWESGDNIETGGLYKQNRDCASTQPNTSGEQLIDDRFVVDDLVVTPAGSDLFRVKGVVRTKDVDAFNFINNNPYETTCKGSAQSASVRTCALEKFDFIVGVRPGAN